MGSQTYCLAAQHDKVMVRVPVLFKDLNQITLMTALQEQCTKCDYKETSTVELLKTEHKVVAHKAALEPRFFNSLEEGKVVFYNEKEMLLEDQDGNIISYRDRAAVG